MRNTFGLTAEGSSHTHDEPQGHGRAYSDGAVE